MSSTNVANSSKNVVSPSPRKHLVGDTESAPVSSGANIMESDQEDLMIEKKKPLLNPASKTLLSSSCSGKRIVAGIMALVILLLLRDAFLTPPEERFLQPDLSDKFLKWVEAHPYWGLGAFLLVIAACVVIMLPIGTPLTLGCGYIYKGVYGWSLGIAVATAVTMLGSVVGAISCFLLGRYMMRDRVRKWIRKYPLFDAIDTAVSEHGLRIMAMLYLTPILPLGPVSYMCGTTSMPLSSFALAKVASLPLMLLYVFMGASTGTLLSAGGGAEDEAAKLEQNKTMLVSGIGLSAVMIACISHYIRKELDKILERQKQEGDSPKQKQDEDTAAAASSSSRKVAEQESVELGMGIARQRRLRLNDHTAGDPLLEGESVGRP